MAFGKKKKVETAPKNAEALREAVAKDEAAKPQESALKGKVVGSSMDE